MEGILSVISIVVDYMFYGTLTITLFLSLKKCFLPDKKGSVRLFIVSLMTNPYLLYWASMLVAGIVAILIMICTVPDMEQILEREDFKDWLLGSSDWITILGVVGAFINVLILLLASLLIGKWLKVHNRSLVFFIYLMFTVVFSLKGNGAEVADYESVMLRKSSNIALSLLLIIALILLYKYVIGALSKLTNKRRVVNWKMFVIPPAVFYFFHLGFSYFVSSRHIQGTTILYAYSVVILFLFIWAFYIIIKNINATNDAVTARDSIKTLSVEVMEALAHTIDAKDKYTNGHSVRVARYSRMIAERMKLGGEFCEKICYMGLLHDIGKIGVPNEIINKPSRLTDSEYDIIKTHPVIGYDILSEIKSSPDLATGARWHHERYDGRGYPDRISEGDIPLEARIIAVADSYDAMTSNRSYRRYLPQDKVRAELVSGKGSQFDPDAADAMIGIIDEDPEYILHE